MRYRWGLKRIKDVEDFYSCWERMTFARETIIRILQNNNEHLTADEIFIKAKKINSNIGLTTVYRTLEKLVSAGKVLKIETGDKISRFELINDNKIHHHHLICKNCGKIIDYTDFMDEEVKLLKDIEEKLSKKYNFLINSHIIQFYGLCEKCK